VGIVRGQSFQLPLTQSDIADMVGLSVVHVNRMIQELRASGLIRWDRKTVTVLDINRLRELADFDPTYLNLIREPR
jgi:CRP-like cAMP-binding protein